MCAPSVDDNSPVVLAGKALDTPCSCSQASYSEQAGPDAGQLPALESPECGNHVIGGSLDVDSEFERRLAVGAQVACHLRTTVKEKLGTPDHHQHCCFHHCYYHCHHCFS